MSTNKLHPQKLMLGLALKRDKTKTKIPTKKTFLIWKVSLKKYIIHSDCQLY